VARSSLTSLGLALGELRRHPLRTLLVSQGVLWAVALMVLPAAVLLGSRRAAIGQAREMGTDRIQVEGAPSAGESGRPQEEDLAPLRLLLPDATVSGMRVSRLTLPGAPSAWLVGGDRGQVHARNLTLERGRWFDPDAGRAEAVIESGLVGDLFGDSEALASRVTLEKKADGSISLTVGDKPEGTPLEIVGILQQPDDAPSDLFGIARDRLFGDLVRNLLKAFGMMPGRVPWIEDGRSLHLARSEIPGSHLDWMVISTDPAAINETSSEVERFLVARGRTPILYSNAAWSVLAKSELDSYLVLHDVFFWVTAGLGLVVLANLLLLSGQRRRREVALRRCEGATRLDIFLQFLWEGVLLAAFGTILGVVIGMILAQIRAELSPAALVTIDWPWLSILKAAVLVLIGSTIASIGPAWIASGSAPVALLRKGT